MSTSPDRARDVARARKLAVRALSPTSDEDKEAESAYAKCCQLVRKHGLAIADLFGAPGVAQSAASVAERARAAAESMRATISDPKVRENASAVTEAARATADALNAFVNLAGRMRAR